MDTKSALFRVYKRLVRSNNISDIEIPPCEAYYLSEAIFVKTGVRYSPEHCWSSLVLEGFCNPDELQLSDEYVLKYFGGVKPDIKELKVKLWIKYKKYLLKEFNIDLPWD